MPDTISNPYNFQSPIGASLRQLGHALFNQPSEARRILEAENALKLRRENENTMALGDVFQQYGTPGFDRGRATNMAIRSGMSPDHLGGYERYNAANTYGAKDPRTTNAFVGAGGSYASTGAGFDEKLAEDRRQFDMKPQVYVDPTTGQPVIGTQRGAVGQQPVMSKSDTEGFQLQKNFGRIGALPPAEQRVLGAIPGAQPRAKMYQAPDGTRGRTFDDTHDAVTGQPLHPQAVIGSIQDSIGGFEGGELAKTRQGIMQRRAATTSAVQIIDDLDKRLSVANADQAVGVLGQAAGVINNVRSQVEAGARLVGVNIEAPSDIRAYEGTFRQIGVQNAQIASTMLDLAFSIAQSREPGKLTTDDVNRALQTIGANLGDPIAMRQVMADVRDRLVRDYKTFESVAQGMYGTQLGVQPYALPGAAPAAPGVASPPPQTAPGAPQTRRTSSGVTWSVQ